MNRRNFFTVLAAVPFVARVLKVFRPARLADVDSVVWSAFRDIGHLFYVRDPQHFTVGSVVFSPEIPSEHIDYALRQVNQMLDRWSEQRSNTLRVGDQITFSGVYVK